MEEHMLFDLIGERIKVQQMDSGAVVTVWVGKLRGFTPGPDACLKVHVVERGEEVGRDIIMPLSSVLRLWRA